MNRIACASSAIGKLGALVLCIGLSACGSDGPTNDLPPAQQPPSTTTTATSPPTGPERAADAPPDNRPTTTVAASPEPAATDTTIRIQSDPFAKADVGTDDRLRQILRQSDKQRPAPLPVPAKAAPVRAAPEPTVIAAAPPPARAEVPVVVTPPSPAVIAPTVAAPPAAAVAVPAAPEPQRPPPLRAIERSQPAFPIEAQREGISNGRVVAAITVLPNGTVGQVEIVESVPARVFDRAVRNTLLRWRFEPIPQQQRASVEIVFRAE